MSRFDDQFAAAGRPLVFSHLGQQVTYSAPDEDDVTLTALVGTIGQRIEDDVEGQRMVSGRSCTITTDPASPQGGVAAPRRKATVTIGGVKWSVVDVTTQTGGLARLELVLSERFELSRRGYRPAGR